MPVFVVIVTFGQGRDKKRGKDMVYCELQTEGQEKRSDGFHTRVQRRPSQVYG